MSDVVYTVETRLATAGTFSSGLGDVGVKADALDSSIKSVGDSITGVSSKMAGVLDSVVDKVASVAIGLAKIGGAAVAGLATYGVVKLNQELENTKISLAAIFQVQGFTKTFADGVELAGDQIAKMKQDVKTLPGDLGQLADIMKMIATPASQGGAGPDAIRKLAGRTMLVGSILGVQQDAASREMAMLLAGRAGAHNILGTRLGLVGDAAQAFNKEGAKQRVADIGKLLDQYKGAEDAFSKSFIANWTTLKDNIKYGFLANATSPLFDAVKRSIISLNEYFDDHKDKVEEIASTVGRRLAGAWEAVEHAVQRVAGVVGPMLDKILHMDPSVMLGHLKHIGATLAEMKIAATALKLGGGLVSGMLGAASGEGGGLMGAVGVGGGLAAAPAAAALTALGVASYATAEQIRLLGNESSSYHRTAVDDMSMTAQNIRSMGSAAAGAADFLSNFGERVGSGWGRLQREVSEIAVRQLGEAGIGTGKIATASVGPLAQRSDSSVPALPERREDISKAKFDELLKQDQKILKGREGHGGMVIQRVEINVSSNQDPAQIAKLTEARLASLARHPRVSRLVPNYSASR